MGESTLRWPTDKKREEKEEVCVWARLVLLVLVQLAYSFGDYSGLGLVPAGLQVTAFGICW